MTNVELARKVPGAKIACVTSDGRDLVLKHKFQHRDCAALIKTLHAIRAAGAINESFWRKPYKGEI